MSKYILAPFILVMLFSCGDAKNNEVLESEAPRAFSFQDLPNEVVLDSTALSSLKGWPEFMAMENSFSVLKRATNTEDLVLAIDDLVEKEKAMAESDYPGNFNKLQIKSRQQVFRTFLYKVKGNLNDRRDVAESMDQMMVAYNALRNQFNILSNNTLDANLILNGQ